MYVADFESSTGVLGTTIWRAPEVLLALKNKDVLTSELFTEKADVYSYGMTCYEILTGHTPFEREGYLPTTSNYELVLSGLRPELPNDLHPILKEVITNCWHHNPFQRPMFGEIVQALRFGPQARDISVNRRQL